MKSTSQIYQNGAGISIFDFVSGFCRVALTFCCPDNASCPMYTLAGAVSPDEMLHEFVRWPVKIAGAMS